MDTKHSKAPAQPGLNTAPGRPRKSLLTRQQPPPDEASDSLTSEQKVSTPFQDSLRQLRRDRRAMVSVAIILFFLLLPLFGPPLYQHIGGAITSTTGDRIDATVYRSPFH